MLSPGLRGNEVSGIPVSGLSCGFTPESSRPFSSLLPGRAQLRSAVAKDGDQSTRQNTFKSLRSPTYFTVALSGARDLKKGHWEGQTRGALKRIGMRSPCPQDVMRSANTAVRRGRPLDANNLPGSPRQLATCCRRQRLYKLQGILCDHS